ncbi:LysR family transcriptional regulator [Streptomyces sp. NPDC097619]|uniref:LysR substrate-binding domain-containing protein n=1 Tax=Streptomyces sp. NPDC097619 TaxID=3157228 RepID=UPI0033177192
MERHEMDAFLMLAEELHFRRATERLGLAQDRISQTIKKLERRIGAPLFERTSRRVALTAVGLQLREDLLPAREQMESALARAVSAGRGIEGILDIGYSSPMAAEVLIKAADLLQSRHPACEVRIHEIQLTDLYGPLRSGLVDLQVTEGPMAEPDLTAGPVLFRQDRVLLVSRDHPFAGYESVSVEDLADTKLITLSGNMPDYWMAEHYPRRTPAGRTVPVGGTANFWPATLVLVAADKGVTSSCAGAEPYLGRPDIVWIPFRDAPTVDCTFIRARQGDSARTRAFIDTALSVPHGFAR